MVDRQPGGLGAGPAGLRQGGGEEHGLHDRPRQPTPPRPVAPQVAEQP